MTWELGIKIKVQKWDVDATLPVFKSAHAACADLYACDDCLIAPGGTGIVTTGLAFEIPFGFEGQIRGRSGLAFTHAIEVHRGTIDADFRGEVKVKLYNHGTDSFRVSLGDRIAQIAIRHVQVIEFVEVEELAPTKRGTAGLGSTGTRDTCPHGNPIESPCCKGGY